MKVGKLFKTAVKFAPIVIPIVKKMLDEKKKTTPTSTRSTRR